MFIKIFKFLFYLIILNFSFLNISNSEIVKKIKILGNDRISNQTIEMFSEVSINDDLKKFELNEVLKKLYNTGFFENVSVNLINNVLEIYIKENPIIENVNYEGIKANKIKDAISKRSFSIIFT